MRRLPIRRRWVALGAVLGFVGFLFFLFPGQRLGFAFTLATGIGTASLQESIDTLEDKAIHGDSFSEDDKEFLADFYRTLATGAKLSIVVRQTGRLMHHYLDGSGSDYRLDAEIFSENQKVRAQLALLEKRSRSSPCGKTFSSPTFYMPDRSKIDSVFGLYHGVVRLRRTLSSDGTCVSRFRAEVPWNWPSYASLEQKYGSSHAENFPLPNLKALVFGRRYALYVDNGLGEYLVHEGLAKPFLAYAEWDE